MTIPPETASSDANAASMAWSRSSNTHASIKGTGNNARLLDTAPWILLLGTAGVLVFHLILQQQYLTHDDIFFKYTADGSRALALANHVNGRFLPGGVFQVFREIGFDLFEYSLLLRLVAYAALMTFAFVFVDRLRPHTPPLDKAICVLLIVAHPYNITALSNVNNLVNATIAYGSLTVAVSLFGSTRSPLRLGLITVALVVTLSSYQTYIYYFIVFVGAYFLLRDATWRRTLYGLAVGGGLALGAMALYFTVYSVGVERAMPALATSENWLLIENFGEARGGANDISSFAVSAFLYFVVILRVLTWPEPILPLYVKMLALLLIAASLYLWSRGRHAVHGDTVAEEALRRRQRLLIMALVLMTGSPLHLYLADTWHSPSVLMHAAAILAALFLLSYDRIPPRWYGVLRAGIAACVFCIALSTAAAMNDLLRMHQKDLDLATSIVRDIEARPEFDREKPLAIVGAIGPDSPHVENAFNYFRMNMSKFTNNWSQYGILEEAAGRRFKRPDADFREQAARMCRGRAQPTALFRSLATPHGTVVCLPDQPSDPTDGA